MNPESSTSSGTDPEIPAKTVHFCLVHDDLWYRLQKRIGLIPEHGEGTLRRAVFFTLLAWLPLVIWAATSDKAFDLSNGESLLNHYSIHIRFLIALPVMILGERLARITMKRLLPRFIEMGLIPEEKRQEFIDTIVRTVRLRNSTMPWVAIAGVIIASILVPETGRHLEEIEWARRDNHLGFGGWWFLCISRPIYQLFLFSWVWRIGLITILFIRIKGIGLSLIPTHPDRFGGMAFISHFPQIFTPLAFSASCVASSKWAHDVAWHGAHISTLRIHFFLFFGMMLVICLLPLLVFQPSLKVARRRGLKTYGALIARHDRQVESIWIDGKPVADRSLLEAPEFGPTCDMGSIYDNVRNMKSNPISKQAVMPIALAAAIPILVLCTMEVPIGDLMGKVFKALL